MKNSFLFLVAAFHFLQGYSQKETFDIATYLPPKDWTRDAKPGIVNFTSVNSATGKFCVLTIYSSKASTGDAQKDFNNDWNQLVVTPYGADANIKSETQTTAEGWIVVSAAAKAKLDGNDFYALLTVISGFGKSMTIRTSLNDVSFTTEVDAFLGSVELDNTKSPTLNNNLAAPVQTTGSSGKFGSMMYIAPPGWKEQIFSDGVVFKPSDLPADEHVAMQIMQPLNFSGSLEQALQQSFDEAATMYNATKMRDVNGGNYATIPAIRSFRGWDYIRCSGGLHIGSGDYPPEFGLDLFVIKINNRFERIAILKLRKNCPGGLSRYYADDRADYRNAIENFLFSIQFTDLPAPSVKPGTIKGEGLVGVWEGISLSVGAVSTSDPLGVRYKVFTPVFFSNGQAYFGTKFPIEGLDELNTWIRAENFRRDWGTWSFSNGKGVLKLPYADIPLRMENGKLIITSNKTDHVFIKTKPVDGARFNGTYALSSKNFMGEETGKTPLIRFSADGKFTDDGALKILNHEPVDCLNKAILPGSGNYEVRNYSILFNYSDGRKIKIAFTGTGFDKTNQSPASLSLSFNEDVLSKQ